MPLRRGANVEAWTLVAVAVLALVGGGIGLVVWGRTVASRLRTEAAAAQAAAAKTALNELRDAEREARAAEPAEPVVDGAPGRAMELNRILATAIDAADTAERRTELRGLLDRATVEVDSGRLHDGAEAVATLRMTIGAGYGALGESDLALRQLRTALAERTKALGERHPDTIRAQMAVEDAEKAAAGAR